MQGFVEVQGEFAALDAQIISISVDSFAAANAFAESLGAEFPILGDFPLNKAGRAYGVYDEDRHVFRRITFLIDEDRVIRAIVDEPREMEKHSQDSLAALKALRGHAE